MVEFNPTKDDFDYEVDPITAEKHGVMILESLRQGRKWLADYDRITAERGAKPVVDPTMQQQPGLMEPRMRQAQEKLIDNLRNYQRYKELRGERMFSRVDAMRAREKALVGEEFARSTVKFLDADDETFDSLLREQGDYESYKDKEGWIRDKSVLRDDYIKRRILRNRGFSDSEIDSGAAESIFRKEVQAGDNEPTINAASRWSRSEINKYDRRKEIAEWGGKTTIDLFLGMNREAVKSFEKRLSEKYPDISDEERTQIRANMNAQRKELEKVFKDIKPLVRKTFNTIAEAEGIKSQFDAPEDAAFKSSKEMLEAIGAIPKEDFGNLVAMLAKTAEAHGQNLNDIDGWMANAVKSFSRGYQDLTGSAKTSVFIDATRDMLETVKAMKDSDYLRRKQVLVKVTKKLTKKGEDPTVNYMLRDSFSILKPIEEEVADMETPDLKYEIVDPSDPEVNADAVKYLERDLRVADYLSEFRNWREQVAKIESKNLLMNDWVYGVARSLPEMGAAATGYAGVALVTIAQKERNMAEIRRRFPEEDWGKYEGKATVAGIQYALLNRLQLKVAGGALKRLPKVGAFVDKISKGQVAATAGLLGATTVAEAGIEAIQDLTLSGTLELFDAFSDDIESFELTEDIKEQIRMFPRTMFAVAPLAIVGVIGQKATDHFGRSPLEKMLSDESLLEAYGVDEKGRAEMRQMDLEQKIDYLEENNATFAENRVEIPAFESEAVEFNAEIVANDNGTFTITDGTTTLEARTPEEAAEAMAQLDPDSAQKVEQVVFGSTEPAFADPRSPDLEFVDDTPRPTPQPAAEPVSSLEFNAQLNQQTPRTGTVSDPRINPFFDDLNDQTLRMFAPGFGSVFQSQDVRARMREGLPPTAREETEGKIPRAEALEFKFRSLLAQRDVPSRTLQRILDEGTRKAKGVEAQFADIAKSLADRIKRYTKKQPLKLREARREQVMSNAYYALRGDNKAMKALPSGIRKVVEQGRRSTDIYSQKLIDSGQIEGDLAKAVGNNIGAYVTREFKIFDSRYDWNYYTIKKQHSDIYDAAMKEIMATEVNGEFPNAKEADQIIREITDNSRSAKEFYSNTSSVKKINTTNFIKRNNDLSPAMLDLLGEVVDPVVNIASTGQKVSRAVITFETQQHMAQNLLAAGLASTTKTGRFTKRIGEETYEYEIVDEDGDPKKMKGTRISKPMKGFDGLYMEPELAAELELFYKPADGKRKSLFESFGDTLATITGVGKFNQVILNPAAYPTNFLGGVGTEILNGRVSIDAKGTRAYFKGGAFRNFGKDPNAPYDVQDQANFYNLDGAEFLKKGGVNSIGRNQLNTEMQQKGLLDNSVFAEDFNQTIARTGLGAKGEKVSRVLSSLYQASDNAIKRSAFAHELNKWAKAEPTKKMDELVDLAAEDVRATTQNYDMVPKVLKELSQRGVFIPTYVSFFYEFNRNTINTVRIAAREITSGNPVLRMAGLKRVLGMAVVGSLLYGLNKMVSQVIAGLTDEEQEAFRVLVPPWLEDMEVGYLRADDKELAFFDPSYLIPHQTYYNGVMAAMRPGTVEEKFERTASNLIGPFFQGNIFQQTVSEVLANQKENGEKVYNEEIVEDKIFAKQRQIAAHLVDSMFLPGFVRTLEKIRKAEKGEVGYKGSTATMNDLMLGVIGIRPYRYDVESDQFVKDYFSGFAYDNQEIKSWVSETKQKQRGKGETADPETGLTPSQMEAEKDVERSMARKVREFRNAITALQKLGIENRRILMGIKTARVPKEFRAKARDLFPKD